MWRIERLDPIGHFVLPVRMIGVVHDHPEICPDAVTNWRPRGLRTQPVPLIAACVAVSTRTATIAWAEA
jgi:hypothetical protein